LASGWAEGRQDLGKGRCGAYLQEGAEAAKLLPESDDRSRRLLRFELELGDVLYAALGYVTGEGSAAYQRAIAMSGKLGEPDRRSERSTGFSAPISPGPVWQGHRSQR
jgi:hypothetical protein